MVSKPRTPDGKRVTVCIKLSEQDAAAIDKARGDRSRSDWGRAALLAAASPEPRKTEIIPLAPKVVISRSGRSRPGADCPHPKARIAKGLCNACGTYVGKT
jgi:hypothetical protein